MRGSSRAAALALAASFLILFALLILLSNGLGSVRLQPGTPIYMPGVEEADLASSETVPLPPLTRLDKILAYVLGGLTALSVLGALISRKLRKLLFQQLFSILGVVLPMLLVVIFVGRLLARWLRRQATGVPDTGPVIPDSLLSNPPTWAIALSAVAIGLALTGIVIYFVWKGAQLRAAMKARKTQRAEDDALRDEVASEALATAARIRQGYDPESEVIRCYQQMLVLLSRREQLATIYLTPREFESALRALGISDRQISLLTEMFELVRYGSRSDRRFEDRALECLDALKASYTEVGHNEI